jgi:hypothetical protein
MKFPRWTLAMRGARAIRAKSRELALALAMAAGLAAMTRGIALLSAPAAWIFAGLSAMVLAYLCLAEV